MYHIQDLRIILNFGGRMSYNTGKKERIHEFLRENRNKSFTLEQICDSILTDGHGRSTVYRLVSEMVAEGLLHRLSDGRTRHCTYQYIGDKHCAEHLHLKCKGCGRLMHLDAETSQEFEKKLLAVMNFDLDDATLLYGRCAECKAVRG